jgi:hypothetical protein
MSKKQVLNPTVDKVTIPKRECSYIAASDLFKGLDALWQLYSESEPPHTWGSNSLSLVSAKSILSYLQELGVDDVLIYRQEFDLTPQLDELQCRCECLGMATYVDLES